MSHSPANERALLIIGSSADERKTYRRLLKRYVKDFPVVVEADDNQSALALEQTQALLCCLICQRTVEDGLDTLASLRREFSPEQLPIVVLIDQPNEDSGLSLLQLGAQDYLAKDGITAARLYGALRNAVQTCNLQ